MTGAGHRRREHAASSRRARPALAFAARLTDSGRHPRICGSASP
ncbi:hypothetical protein ACFOPN_21630 [Xanthomonas hyacinthi]